MAPVRDAKQTRTLVRFTFTIDSDNPAPLAAFWADALGYTAVGEFGVFSPLFPADENEPPINIQRVPDPKGAKSRMHLDIHVDDLAAEVERLVLLGATRVREDVVNEHDHKWVVMADPDGNVFCVVERPSQGDSR